MTVSRVRSQMLRCRCKHAWEPVTRHLGSVWKGHYCALRAGACGVRARGRVLVLDRAGLERRRCEPVR